MHLIYDTSAQPVGVGGGGGIDVTPIVEIRRCVTLLPRIGPECNKPTSRISLQKSGS